jgi:hypothetical protein
VGSLFGAAYDAVACFSREGSVQRPAEVPAMPERAALLAELVEAILADGRPPDAGVG